MGGTGEGKEDQLIARSSHPSLPYVPWNRKGISVDKGPIED